MLRSFYSGRETVSRSFFSTGPSEKKADEPAAGILLPLPPGLTRDAEIVNDRLTTLEIVAAVGYSPSRGEYLCVCGGWCAD